LKIDNQADNGNGAGRVRTLLGASVLRRSVDVVKEEATLEVSIRSKAQGSAILVLWTVIVALGTIYRTCALTSCNMRDEKLPGS